MTVIERAIESAKNRKYKLEKDLSHGISDGHREKAKRQVEVMNVTIEALEKLKELKNQPKADCSECSRRKFYQQGYQDGLNADKWIPCEERLPECEWGSESEALMFQIKNSDYIEVGHYGEGGEYRDRYFRTYTDALEGYEASDVIAWQPLPQPYKKEGAE